MMAPRYVQNTKVKKPARQQGTTTTTPSSPSTTVPQSPPSATLIPQVPTDPGYTAQNTRPKVVQGPALYGTADQVNTPAYAERQGTAEGSAAAEAEIKRQKELLAAMKAAMGGGGDSAATAAEKKKMAALKKNADAIRKALSSGSYGTMYDDLITKLTGQTSDAQGQINTGYAGLKTMLEGQGNPYAGLQFKATQAEAPLMDFLKSQGGSQDALLARMNAENTSNTAATSQFQNIADLLSSRQVSGNTQRTADVEAARLASLQDLQSQNAGFQFNIEQQKQAERNRLNQILLSLASQGVNVGGIY
jgi:hypothetical protein